MKTSKLTQFLAAIVGAVAGVLATLAGLIWLAVKIIWSLPTTAIEAGAFWRNQFKPQPTNAEINATVMARPEMQDGRGEFIVVECSGKNGDEDRKLPFPKGFIQSYGVCPGDKVPEDKARKMATDYLKAAQLRAMIEHAISSSQQRPQA